VGSAFNLLFTAHQPLSIIATDYPVTGMEPIDPEPDARDLQHPPVGNVGDPAVNRLRVWIDGLNRLPVHKLPVGTSSDTTARSLSYGCSSNAGMDYPEPMAELLDKTAIVDVQTSRRSSKRCNLSPSRYLRQIFS